MWHDLYEWAQNGHVASDSRINNRPVHIFLICFPHLFSSFFYLNFFVNCFYWRNHMWHDSYEWAQNGHVFTLLNLIFSWNVFIDAFICDMTHMYELKMAMLDLTLGSIIGRYVFSWFFPFQVFVYSCFYWRIHVWHDSYEWAQNGHVRSRSIDGGDCTWNDYDIFHKRATKYRSLLRKMTYKDKGSYESPSIDGGCWTWNNYDNPNFNKLSRESP